MTASEVTPAHPVGGRPPGDRPHLLIVEARFYDEISDRLLEGARRALEAGGATFDRVIVPGALEIPAAIRLALDGADYDAFVALGCVIRGETSHYDIVAGESARGLTELAVQRGALIGNGILTTDDGQQARVRADPGGKDKGGAAARAALALTQIKRCFRL
ncbi:MAG TPA: 6,7-dimethyl-8-ribityllumazine synthase [Geminicoccaceae bacterium]|nr:6,7-dimethyl-8-ribityllumazine synthase [Geminicoccaceae bacterium]